MTVKELIDHLKTLPAELECVFAQYSDSAQLDVEDISIVEVTKVRDSGGRPRYVKGWHHDIGGETMHVVHFPGN